MPGVYEVARKRMLAAATTDEQRIVGAVIQAIEELLPS
jgi:hypothetical protein